MTYFPLFCVSPELVGGRMGLGWLAGYLLLPWMGLWGYGDTVAFLFLGWDGMGWARD